LKYVICDMTYFFLCSNYVVLIDNQTVKVKRMATHIIVTKKGNICPKCGKGNNFNSVIVEDINNESHIIRAFKCTCGTFYINKKNFMKTGMGEFLYVNEDGSQLIDPKLYSTGKSKRRLLKEAASADKCIVCKKRSRFPGSDKCFECLKYENERNA